MAYRILVADDEADIARLLQDLFTRQGYQVLAACGGKEALELCSQKPDLILLDVNMPDMDGFTLCRQIRDFVSCPILFLTARIEDADKVMGFAAGGDDYILKPFSNQELLARVAAHLRREEHRQGQAQHHGGGGNGEHCPSVFILFRQICRRGNGFPVSRVDGIYIFPSG